MVHVKGGEDMNRTNVVFALGGEYGRVACVRTKMYQEVTDENSRLKKILNESERKIGKLHSQLDYYKGRYPEQRKH